MQIAPVELAMLALADEKASDLLGV